MRRLFFAAALVALAAVCAHAQQEEETARVELFGGYAYGGSGSHGWDGSVAFNANRWLGVVADFGGQYTSLDAPDSSERIRTHSFLFGPRFSARRSRHVTPFAHALFGAAHNDSRAREAGLDLHFNDNSFALALGGGLDVRLGRRVAVRAFQLDYLRTGFFGQTQHNGRLAFGLVLRLGKQ
jgi:opacity protein-like surface antigen